MWLENGSGFTAVVNGGGRWRFRAVATSELPRQGGDNRQSPDGADKGDPGAGKWLHKLVKNSKVSV